MRAGARKDVICSERGGRVEQRRSGERMREMKSARAVQSAMAMERKAQGPKSQNCDEG